MAHQAITGTGKLSKANDAMRMADTPSAGREGREVGVEDGMR